jgi:hypothetical protein
MFAVRLRKSFVFVCVVIFVIMVVAEFIMSRPFGRGIKRSLAGTSHFAATIEYFLN